ncbi:MAG: 6-carboxytetrahydropterin synthase QueD [Phycisphaerales bacterium]|nr:6-carboxytetrahydropterin synthase QueD [Planctomycetota bacterium]
MSDGGAPIRVRLAKTFSFEAAHFLPTFPEGHKCRRLHGHSFRLEVLVAGEVDPAKGYLIDYGDLKRLVGPIVDELDHRCLNDLDGLENPTSEMIAAWIWRRIESLVPNLDTIVVHETCTARCEFRG